MHHVKSTSDLLGHFIVYQRFKGSIRTEFEIPKKMNKFANIGSGSEVTTDDYIVLGSDDINLPPYKLFAIKYL